MKRVFLVLLPLFLFISCNDSATTNGSIGSSVHKQIDTLRYVAIGASDAEGWGADTVINGKDTLIEGYVFLIERQLRTFVKSVGFNNLGIAGQNIIEMNRDQKDKAIRLKPDLITIWAGGNDFIDIMDDDMSSNDFKVGLTSMLSTVHNECPNAKIVIANLPDMTKLPRFEKYFTGKSDKGKALVSELNTIINEAALKYNISFVDMYNNTLVSNPKNICEDGFHPSSLGYRLMKDKYMEKINSFYPYQ